MSCNKLDFFKIFFFNWYTDSEETLHCSVDNVILAFMSSFVQYSAGVPSAGCRRKEEEQCIFRVREESECGME